MSNKYTTTKHRMSNAARRWLYLGVCVVMFMGLLAAVWPGRANAYNQVSDRSIKMSSSAVNATNVAYQVNFTTVTDNQTVGSIVVEFCDNSPMLGDSCTAGAGFLNVNKASLSLNNITGNAGVLGLGLAINTTASTTNKVVLTASAPGQVANGAVSFTLGNGTSNGITNPGTTATFYARIMTYTNTTGDDGGNENNATDGGGVAISTANQLRVTAKVQEALFFCVYTAADCQTGGTDVTLGDENGVLASNTTTYKANAYFEVSSNAVHGVSISLKGGTLKSGSFSIDPAGSACLQDPTASGTEMFGLRMAALGAGTTASTPYDCLDGFHGFDTTNTTSLFGDEIAKTTGATDISASTIEFAAKSANTSEAGVYTTTLTLVATASY